MVRVVQVTSRPIINLVVSRTLSETAGPKAAAQVSYMIIYSMIIYRMIIYSMIIHRMIIHSMIIYSMIIHRMIIHSMVVYSIIIHSIIIQYDCTGGGCAHSCVSCR